MSTITVEIEYDEDTENPREWGPACRLFLGGNRGINETDHAFSDYDTTAAFEEDVLTHFGEGWRTLPVYHYTHGNVSLSIAPIPNPHYGFDSGRAGVIFVPPGYTDEHAESELSTYAQYLNGEVFRVSVQGAGIDETCGGFYSIEGVREFVAEALSEVVL